MRKTLFDENSQRELLQKGYTKIDLLSSEEVAYLLKELGQLRPDDDFAPKGEESGFTFHCTNFDTNLEYRRKVDRLIRKVFSTPLKRHLVDYKMMICVFFIKPPDRGELGLHQDILVTSDFADRHVTVWCPLVDVDESNGTLYVVEGSHKIVPNIPAIGAPSFFASFVDSLRENYAKPISLKAGEALIFDANLIHGSPDNRSALPRCTAQFLCVPAEASPVYYYFNPALPDGGLEMLQLQSEAFFIEHTIPELLVSRPENLNRLGIVENRNRVLSEEEFAEALRTGIEIKPVMKFLPETGRAEERKSLSQRIKGYLRM